MLTDEKRIQMLETMALIRAYEERLIDLSIQGKLHGLCSQMGQEACAVGVMAALLPSDLIMTNHRSAGHLIAKGADPERMMAEVMGKATGYCKGKSGPLHISAKEIGVYLTSTIVGGELSMVSGIGLSLSMLQPGKMVSCFFGDGAACEGVFHESLNIASMWNLPILYFCENNEWQAFVARKDAMKNDRVSDWAINYGMPARSVDGNDVEAVYAATVEAVEWIRAGKGPYFLEGLTYRLRGHLEPDPDYAYVPSDELEAWKEKDPIETYKAKLLNEEVLTIEEWEQMRERVQRKVHAALEFAVNSPFPGPEELLTDVYA